MYYKGTGARILGNYFAFNSFEQRTAYTLNNMAQRSVVAYNTLLYNGDKAGHYSWARGNIHHHNLVIGCVEIKFYGEACSMAWRCRFVTARRSRHGRVIAET